jgi:hypothetical protein
VKLSGIRKTMPGIGWATMKFQADRIQNGDFHEGCGQAMKGHSFIVLRHIY